MKGLIISCWGKEGPDESRPMYSGLRQPGFKDFSGGATNGEARERGFACLPFGQYDPVSEFEAIANVNERMKEAGEESDEHLSRWMTIPAFNVLWFSSNPGWRIVVIWILLCSPTAGRRGKS